MTQPLELDLLDSLPADSELEEEDGGVLEAERVGDKLCEPEVRCDEDLKPTDISMGSCAF